MTAFHYTKEISINANDVAEVLVEQMYDDGDAFADLINEIAASLLENDFDTQDAHNYAARLDANGMKLVKELLESAPIEASKGIPE